MAPAGGCRARACGVISAPRVDNLAPWFRRPKEGQVKIARIKVYKVDLPLHEGRYNWSGGKSVSVFDSTAVAIETDAGTVGWGEVCPLGPFYLPAYAAGARAGIRELGPHLLGEDPRQLGKLNRLMDSALLG